MCQDALIDVVGDNKCLRRCAQRASSVCHGVSTIRRLSILGLSDTRVLMCCLKRWFTFRYRYVQEICAAPFKWSRKPHIRRMLSFNFAPMNSTQAGQRSKKTDQDLLKGFYTRGRMTIDEGVLLQMELELNNLNSFLSWSSCDSSFPSPPPVSSLPDYFDDLKRQFSTGSFRDIETAFWTLPASF